MLNSLDTAIVIVMLLCLLSGYFKGFFAEVFSIIGLLVSIVMAGRYYGLLAEKMITILRLKPLTDFVAFMFILFGVMVAFAILRLVVKKTAVGVDMGWADHLLGVLLGAIKGLVFSSIVVFMIISIWGRDIGLIRHSRAVPVICRLSQVTVQLLPEKLQQRAEKYLPAIIENGKEGK